VAFSGIIKRITQVLLAKTVALFVLAVILKELRQHTIGGLIRGLYPQHYQWWLCKGRTYTIQY